LAVFAACVFQTIIFCCRLTFIIRNFGRGNCDVVTHSRVVGSPAKRLAQPRGFLPARWNGQRPARLLAACGCTQAGRRKRFGDSIMANAQTIREQTDDFADRAAQKIGSAANTAGAAVRDASQRVSSTVHDVSDRATAATKDLSRRVEEQPLTSVLVAAAAGFVIGLLFSRR